jgi:hypothetical protein
MCGAMNCMDPLTEWEISKARDDISEYRFSSAKNEPYPGAMGAVCFSTRRRIKGSEELFLWTDCEYRRNKYKKCIICEIAQEGLTCWYRPDDFEVMCSNC